jgi:hypothetical protein
MPLREVLGVLHRAGFTEAQIDEIKAELSDPVDLDDETGILMRHGLTREGLMGMMGGSP